MAASGNPRLPESAVEAEAEAEAGVEVEAEPVVATGHGNVHHGGGAQAGEVEVEVAATTHAQRVRKTQTTLTPTPAAAATMQRQLMRPQASNQSPCSSRCAGRNEPARRAVQRPSTLAIVPNRHRPYRPHNRSVSEPSRSVVSGECLGGP